jgi:hypothetical protein
MSANWMKILGSFAIAGPSAMAIGYAILMVRSGQGPDSGWFISHAFLLAGVGLLLPTIIGIRFLLNKNKGAIADIGMTLAFIGGFTLIGQFAIDLAVGLLAVDQSEMIDLFKSISASPIITLPFQSVGPIMFYSGLLVSTSLLWTNRVISWWAGLIAVLGIISIGCGAITGIALLTFLGFLGMFIGFIPVGWEFFALSSE